jgi:hypothetical protein
MGWIGSVDGDNMVLSGGMGIYIALSLELAVGYVALLHYRTLTGALNPAYRASYNGPRFWLFVNTQLSSVGYSTAWYACGSGGDDVGSFKWRVPNNF